uniref:C2H2-type domain-containing protein n=1 Tax=Anopheles epiroticus TaxID=199890 RepID=A0A182P0Q3_9DIPT
MNQFQLMRFSSRRQSTTRNTSKMNQFYVKVGTDYYCTLCSAEDPVKTDSLKSIAQHLADEHSQEAYVCDLCDIIYFQQSSYVEHLAEHSATSDQDTQPEDTLSCTICSETFESKHALEQHRKIHPNGGAAKSWSCEICDKRANRTLEFETDTFVNDGTGESSEPSQEMEGSDEDMVQVAYICEEGNVEAV